MIRMKVYDSTYTRSFLMRRCESVKKSMNIKYDTV